MMDYSFPIFSVIVHCNITSSLPLSLSARLRCIHGVWLFNVLSHNLSHALQRNTGQHCHSYRDLSHNVPMVHVIFVLSTTGCAFLQLQHAVIEQPGAVNYVYPMIGYSDICHCNTRLINTPTASPSTKCNVTYTGDSTSSCGGESWHITERI